MENERLIRNLDILEKHNETHIPVLQLTGGTYELDLIKEIISDCRELLRKIENKTLIDLPCKVGTVVYQIYKDCSNCPHFKETGWEYDCWCAFASEESKTMFEFDGDKDCIYIIEETKFTYNHIEDFGKDIFLTKAEAKAKLEKLKGGGKCIRG